MSRRSNRHKKLALEHKILLARALRDDICQMKDSAVLHDLMRERGYDYGRYRKLAIKAILGQRVVPKVSAQLHKELASFQVRDSVFGICWHLVNHCDELKEIAFFWPQNSGRREYFVPHKSMLPREAYNRTEDLWAGAYGRKRWEFIEWALSLEVAQ